jgi:hypothetical protein
MDHEISPLLDMKMLEAYPICKLMDTYLKNKPERQPPTIYYNIETVSLHEGFCILVLVAKTFVLIL